MIQNAANDNVMRTKKCAVIAILACLALFALMILIAVISVVLSRMDSASRSSDAYQAAIEARIYVADYWRIKQVLPESLDAFFDGRGGKYSPETRSLIHYTKKEDTWAISLPINENEVQVFSGIKDNISTEN